jgi:hypothetical protein
VLDSQRSARCGHPNTAARPPDRACTPPNHPEFQIANKRPQILDRNIRLPAGVRDMPVKQIGERKPPLLAPDPFHQAHKRSRAGHSLMDPHADVKTPAYAAVAYPENGTDVQPMTGC